MIDVKQAVKTATQMATDLFGKEVARILLEEVELSDDGIHWYVTLSLYPPADLTKLFMTGGLTPAARYKRFRLRAADGAFLGVSSRKL